MQIFVGLNLEKLHLILKRSDVVSQIMVTNL